MRNALHGDVIRETQACQCPSRFLGSLSPKTLGDDRTSPSMWLSDSVSQRKRHTTLLQTTKNLTILSTWWIVAKYLSSMCQSANEIRSKILDWWNVLPINSEICLNGFQRITASNLKFQQKKNDATLRRCDSAVMTWMVTSIEALKCEFLQCVLCCFWNFQVLPSLTASESSRVWLCWSKSIYSFMNSNSSFSIIHPFQKQLIHSKVGVSGPGSKSGPVYSFMSAFTHSCNHSLIKKKRENKF